MSGTEGLPLGWSRCQQCHTPYEPRATFYRYMIAEHQNGKRPYQSKRRVNDILLCGDCHAAASSALAARHNLYERQERLQERARDLASYMHEREHN